MFIAAMSISGLVYVLVLQYLLAFKLGWFPISGYVRGPGAVAYLALPWLILLVNSLRFGVQQKWLRNFKRNLLEQELPYLDVDMALKKKAVH